MPAVRKLTCICIILGHIINALKVKLLESWERKSAFSREDRKKLLGGDNNQSRPSGMSKILIGRNKINMPIKRTEGGKKVVWGK